MIHAQFASPRVISFIIELCNNDYTCNVSDSRYVADTSACATAHDSMLSSLKRAQAVSAGH